MSAYSSGLVTVALMQFAMIKQGPKDKRPNRQHRPGMIRNPYGTKSTTEIKKPNGENKKPRVSMGAAYKSD